MQIKLLKKGRKKGKRRKVERKDHLQRIQLKYPFFSAMNYMSYFLVIEILK